MPIVNSRTQLSQGASSSESVAWTASASKNTTLTGTGLPVVAAGDFFEIRNSPIAGNNGLYIATGTPSTSSVSCTKVNGADPTNDTSETVTWLGDTTTYKSVFFDCAGYGVYILEKGNVDSAGVTGKAIYSFMMQEWKDDSYLIANAPFPMLTIDSDAGKYIIGQNAAGNNTGWNWVDNGTHSIRTRKLLRNAGWDEVDVNGVTTARYVGVVTLGTFYNAADKAYYKFGNDTTVDDTVDFTFADAVNEPVQFYNYIGDLSGDTPSFATTTTITRATGSFVTDGFKVGGQIEIIGSTSNDGVYELSVVTALSMTITTTWTVEAWGSTAIAVNNDNAMTLALRPRDGSGNGSTFAQANLASAGKTELGNFVYSFPLGNAEDLKITALDSGIDANSDGAADVSPYSGMSITYYNSAQSKGGSGGLVGGPYNFGIVIEGNNGTAQEVYEFVQWSLRSTGGFGTGDIDADADTAIGRMMDGIMRFVGDNLEVGSVNGASSGAPYNPDGGGSGVYIDNLAAASKNNVSYLDNTWAFRSHPESISVTLDFNQVLIEDTTTEYDLFYDRTIRTPASTLNDLVMVNATSKFTSAGSNLPTNTEIAVGKYVRISGLTGADAAMNGVYQIDAINTSGQDWTVSRYDGVAVADVAASAVDLDQNCIDTPNAILVHTDVKVVESGSNITFTAPDLINDSNSGMGVFTAGDIIEVIGSTGNDGIYEVGTVLAGSLELVEQTISTEGSSGSSEVFKVVSGLAAADIQFSYDYDNNSQGGRAVGDTFVQAKAIGSTSAQYVASTVQTIETGTPLTIPLVAQTERNYS